MVSAPKPFSFWGGPPEGGTGGGKTVENPGKGCISSDELRSEKDKGAKYLCRNGLGGLPGKSLGLEGSHWSQYSRKPLSGRTGAERKLRRNRGVESNEEGSRAKGRFVRLRVTGVRVVKFAWKRSTFHDRGAG